MTSVLYSFTFILYDMLFSFHILLNLQNCAHATPIQRLMSIVHFPPLLPATSPDCNPIEHFLLGRSQEAAEPAERQRYLKTLY